MIRVLLLLDEQADFQAARAAEQLARGLGSDFEAEVQRIGVGGTYAHVPEAIFRLRRAAKRFDLVHAFGTTALTVAAVGGTSARIAFTPLAVLRASALRWLRAVMAYRDVQVICPAATQRRICVERGVPLERCHLIRPGVDFSRVRRRRDAELRARLGIGENDHVLLAAGESTRPAAHRDAAWAASILHVMDERYRLLLWGRGDQAKSVKRFTAALGQPDLLALAEQRLRRTVEFEELLSAADTIVVSADGPVATLPIATCMAAGLPIVATVTSTVAELLEDRHTAVMTQPGSPKALAQRVIDLHGDASLQWSIADMARTEAYEYFSLTRFLNQHRAAYRRLAAGGNVEIPEQAPGAGLRFHGRG
jgi:glycosyltransferase involved in cell wall biosynthesis